MPESSLILVVDDNEHARYAKVRVLRQAGHEVLEAASGEEALRLVTERTPRLVVLDVNLPDLTGWEVCRRIKSDAATSSILVLQVSATHVHERDTVRALEGGADASLTEPIEPPVLVATIRALLRARLAEDALREALEREQAARAAAEAANRSKDEFLATLSHELRSPLGAILTWVTLLRSREAEPARMARGLEAIERNARLQARMIEELLDVSRIVSGKMRLDVGQVEASAVVEAAMEGIRPAADAKEITVAAAVAPDAGPLYADAARLQQVVWNLLSNAIKFTPRGGRVEVGVERAGSETRIHVTDTGRGIEPGFVPHVFERFRQADSSTTRSEGGLGLGLAIVRHLVELHGGTVEVQSAGPGSGTTFRVRLPMRAVRPTAAPYEPEAVPAAAPPTGLAALTGVRVLVLDDEHDAREAIGAVLEGCGAEVTTAPSVRHAIELLAQASVDVVVSDIAMPGQDGFHFIRALRSEAATRAIPALALTAHAGAEQAARIRGAGFHDCLAKPVEAGALAGAVARLTGRA